MRKAALILFLLSVWVPLRAQFAHSGDITAQSRSGLFTIHGPGVSSKSLYFNHFSGNQPIKLDPALLAVSCEQIKELLFAELGYGIRQQLIGTKKNLGLSRLFIVLHADPNQPITLSEVPAVNDGKSYRVDMPNEVYASRLIETVVEALLVDMANVHNAGAMALPPHWLTEGFVAHLQAVGLETLPLEANLPVTKIKLRKEPVADLHERFRDTTPLTFEEMSWPEKLTKERTAVYNDSTQLFVYQLLQLRNGRACFRQMINNLSQYKNWQFAFLDAFSAQFNNVVDVEKWWALNLVNFTGRNPQQIWSRAETEKKLAAALKVPAQVYASEKALPRRAELTLQQVINEWDLPRQVIVLQKVVGQLRLLRLRTATELLPVVDGYRTTLEEYLRERGPVESHNKNSPGVNSVKRTTCKKLDKLDRELGSKEKKPVVPGRQAAYSP